MQLSNGEYVVGILKEVKSEPWKNDPSKFNHRLVLVSPYLDGYGNQQTGVTTIDVLPDDLTSVQSSASALRDKQVLIPVAMSAKTGGRTGAWLSRRMIKGSVIQEIKPSVEVKKVG